MYLLARRGAGVRLTGIGRRKGASEADVSLSPNQTDDVSNPSAELQLVVRAAHENAEISGAVYHLQYLIFGWSLK